MQILLIEDEPAIAITTKMVLERFSHQVRTAGNGEEGIAKARELRPDLVITDVMMPGIDGVETAIRLRTLYPEMRIILFSGHAATKNLLLAGQKYGHSFEVLAKPIHPQILLDVVEGRRHGQDTMELQEDTEVG